jgi:hypothetical protein
MMVNLVRYYDIIGTLISQSVFLPEVIGMEDEGDLFTAHLLIQSAGALSLQLFGIGSAYSLFVSAVPLFVALFLDAFLDRGGLVNLGTYTLGMFVPLLGSTKMACIVLDVFVPLVCSTTFPSSSTFYII